MTGQVTILGAGIVGICTALSLVERGVGVRLIDRDAPGQATSFGNAGVISPWSIIPQSLPGTWKKLPRLMFGPSRALTIRPSVWPRMLPWGMRFLAQGKENRTREIADAMALLCGPSIELYQRHLQGTGAEDLLRPSMYVHAFRDGSKLSLRSLDYAIRREKGADLELVGGDALRAIEPAISRDFQAAVLIKDQARAMSPGRIGRVLSDKARRLGVDVVTDEIQALERRETGWRIACATRSYESETVVIAMGAWSRDLLRGLGLDVPLMAERGYHIELPTPGIEINNSVMDADAKLVASSMEGGARFAGQAEFAPIDTPPDPRKQAHLERLAKSAFPGLDTSGASFWMGRRPSFPDSLPALGEAPGHKGLFLNFGHSHYGLMMAPKSGEIAADLIAGRPANEDLGALSVSRFL
jgi:D-amino-acid dehydrogenase